MTDDDDHDENNHDYNEILSDYMTDDDDNDENNHD